MSERKDPYRNSRFLLEIDGITQAGFSDVTIPDISTDPVEYREGNEDTTVRKLPGLTKYGNLTLKWGITDSLELFNWRKLVMQGKMGDSRKNIAIVLMDEEGNAAARWEFKEAWPIKYDTPDLSAKGNDVAIETLEIAHEGMDRTQ
ncbi:MAG: phage tail protein [Euryarchaeota archaeon]|uniref:Phage tail protein n=1 Tax=Candidatus Methanogaster sp. TaxID=3386292 RepID=A0AC61L3U8_9EURY|nr:phage tail protein [Euryarchaeota archaeon]PXF60965.1 MAG: phage tail protein [ANME-2 cluster archaeon]